MTETPSAVPGVSFRKGMSAQRYRKLRRWVTTPYQDHWSTVAWT